MTNEQMKTWIDQASYKQLLDKWRFEPPGSPWFNAKMGEYFAAKMKEKKPSTAQHSRISKELGWKD